MGKSSFYFVLIALAITFASSCTEQKEHMAPAVNPKDSVPMMVSYGVNTLISDSGVIRYRIVTERWEVNTALSVPRWIFHKGLFLTHFDETFHVQAYVQGDTAYYYTAKKLWELRGRVSMLNKDGLRFTSEKLYWDQNAHELYSDVPFELITPERTLRGSYFRSDEQMRKYYVSNSSGSFEQSDMVGEDTLSTKPDEVKESLRQPSQPRPRR